MGKRKATARRFNTCGNRPLVVQPLPSSPKKKPETNVTSASAAFAGSSKSPSASSTSNTNANKGQEKSKKSRPPPGIPIPPDLKMAASSASTSTQTQTSSQSKATFNGYTQSKMNPMQAPFYPPGYSPVPPTSGASSSAYSTAASSMPMGPAAGAAMPPQQYMYPTPQPPRPPVYPPASVYGPYGPAGYPPLPFYSSGYGSYGMPFPQTMYDYYPGPGAVPIRGPMTNAYSNYAAPQAAATKPPPGFNYKPTTPATSTTKATSTSTSEPAAGYPSVTEATDCSLKVSTLNPAPAPAKNPFADHNEKPEWISKLEVVRDLVLSEDLSAESVKGKLKEIIGDINADTSKTEALETSKLNPSAKSYAAVAAKASAAAATAAASARVDDSLTNNLNGLSIRNREFSAPIPLNIAETSSNRFVVESTATSPVTPARSESEFSVKSDDRESTRDEIKQSKIEQLRLFVMSQSKILKKT